MLKNIVNRIQRRFMRRVRCMLFRADALVAATPADRWIVSGLCGRSSLLIPETGVSKLSPRPYRPSETLKVGWCGVFEARKALDLALKALAELKRRGVKVKLTIIGSGPLDKKWRNLSRRLGVSDMCEWTGRVDHQVCMKHYGQAGCFSADQLAGGFQHGGDGSVVDGVAGGLPQHMRHGCGGNRPVRHKGSV